MKNSENTKSTENKNKNGKNVWHETQNPKFNESLTGTGRRIWNGRNRTFI